MIDERLTIKYFGIQYSATGIWGYSFRDGDNEVVHLSSLVLLRPDIHISGFGKELCHKNYDSEMTLFPGVRRNILSGGQIEGYYEYVSVNEILISAANEILKVNPFKNRWHIFNDSKMLAKIERKKEEVRFTENGLDMVERFIINVLPDVKEELYPYIFAIPVLGF